MILYYLGIHVYTLLLRVVSLWHPKARLQVRGRRKSIDLVESYRSRCPQRPTIWMHCSSLGEYEQGAHILWTVKKELPHLGIALSFYSPSGYEVKKNTSPADVVFYLPGDTPRKMATLVRSLDPLLYLTVKYDYWYCLLEQLHKNQIPTAVVAARFKEKAIYWKSWAGLLRRQLSKIDHFFLLRDRDRDLLARYLPSANYTIAGDPRIDTVVMTAQASPTYSEIEMQASNYTGVIVYGSVWADDREICQGIVENNEDYLHIIAPHEIADVDFWLQVFPEANLWSDGVIKGVIILNTIGHLKHIYQYSDLTYIGGGFHKGLHNTLEPAAHYNPLLVGPDFKDFPEVEYFVDNGLALVVRDSDSAEQMSCLQLEKDRQVVESQFQVFFNQHAGASALVIDYIRQHDA